MASHRMLRRGISQLAALLVILCSPFHRSVAQEQAAPAGATALCHDGTYSFTQSHKGACSHHGGVAHWIASSQITAPQSATQHGTISASQAKNHVGETQTVCGVVASTRYASTSRGEPTFLNLDQPYPNQVFTIVIWGSARSAFPAPPEEAYRNRHVCVSSLIDVYHGVPQVVVGTPTAIQVTSQ